MKYKRPGNPTTETPGNMGDFYLNTDTGDVFVCIGSSYHIEVHHGFVTIRYAAEPKIADYKWLKYGEPTQPSIPS